MKFDLMPQGLEKKIQLGCTSSELLILLDLDLLPPDEHTITKCSELAFEIKK